MTPPPLVSAIIPAYNCAPYLPRAINSVLAQSYPNIECIVVNDGSTDNSGEVARSFGDRVKVIDQINGGASAARNTGIRHAHGELIAFLDADDYWLAGKIARQVQIMQSYPEVVLVSTGFTDHADWELDPLARENQDDTYVVHRDFLPLFLDPYLGTPTVMVRQQRIAEAGLFDPALPIAEDIDFYFRICKDHAYARLDQVLVCIHHRPDSLCRTEPGYQRNLEVIDRVERLHPEFHARHPDEFVRCRLALFQRWASECVYRGHGRSAREVLQRSRRHGQLDGYLALYMKSFLAALLYRLRTGTAPEPSTRVMQ